MDINVFVKFDEIPSLPIQNIKEKPNCGITKDNNSIRNGPYPLFFYYKCSSVDINVFAAKFDEIPSLHVQVNKENPKSRRLRITKGNNSKKNMAPSPYFSIINVHLVDINVLPNVMKFRHCLFKIPKNQNVAGGRMDRRKNSART